MRELVALDAKLADKRGELGDLDERDRVVGVREGAAVTREGQLEGRAREVEAREGAVHEHESRLAAREVNVDERETQVTAEREAVAADLEKRRALAAELAHLRDEAAREKSATDEQRAARDVLVRELVVLDGKLADKRGELGDLDEREAAVEAFEKGKRALEVEYRRDFSVPNFAQGVVSVLRWHNIEPPDRLMAAFVRTAETASPHPVVELSAEMAREESRKRRGGPERRDGREEGIGSG